MTYLSVQTYTFRFAHITLDQKECKTSFGDGIIKAWWEKYLKNFAILEGLWLNEHVFWGLFRFFLMSSVSSLDSVFSSKFPGKIASYPVFYLFSEGHMWVK